MKVTDRTHDAIVVGAGFGGSTCAALLAKRGLNVLLLEKNSRAGGKAMTISKRGFTHELWPVISAPAVGNLYEAVLREVGADGNVELLTTERQGSIYISPAGELKRFPYARTPAPDQLFDLLEVPEDERPEALRLLAGITLMELQEIQKLDDVSFHDWLGRYRTPQGLYSFLAAICNGVFMVPNEVLAASEAVRTIQEIFLRGGGAYCKGGIGRVAEALAEAVQAHGGRVLVRSRVESIIVEAGRVAGVVTSEGTFRAPVVVSNAGLQPTVLKLVGEEHFDPAYVAYVSALKPSWGMMGSRYFLDAPVVDEPYGMIFSDEAYWTLDRWQQAQVGKIPRDLIIWFIVPSQLDPDLAPAGKQCILTGVWCPADPAISEQEKQVWWDKADEMMVRVWPDLPAHLESQERYSTAHVSAVARDQVLPGAGGECIGLGQLVGQCGRHKPSAQAPLEGLFFVGTDAGGYGCGAHHAVNSGVNVAGLVLRHLGRE